MWLLLWKDLHFNQQTCFYYFCSDRVHAWNSYACFSMLQGRASDKERRVVVKLSLEQAVDLGLGFHRAIGTPPSSSSIASEGANHSLLQSNRATKSAWMGRRVDCTIKVLNAWLSVVIRPTKDCCCAISGAPDASHPPPPLRTVPFLDKTHKGVGQRQWPVPRYWAW